MSRGFVPDRSFRRREFRPEEPFLSAGDFNMWPKSCALVINSTKLGPG